MTQSDKIKNSNVFALDWQTTFYHATDKKIKGKLKANTAPNFGTAVYFGTNKELLQYHFGNNVYEVQLSINNPVYTNTDEYEEVEELALENSNEQTGADDWDIAEINSAFISDAAKSLGYDAIIDRGSKDYENEIAVLDESKIIYADDKATLLGIETLTVDGVQRPRHNSKGQVIHPTDEGIRNFWRWFGDSKVVDEQGRPLVVYHGTNSEFDTFEERFIGMSRDAGYYGKGFYFAFNKDSKYAKYAEGEAQYYGNRIVEAYVKADKPFDISSLSVYEGKEINSMFHEPLVFLLNIAKQFPEIAKKIKLVKRGEYNGDGTYQSSVVNISILPELFKKYEKNLVIEPVYSNGKKDSYFAYDPSQSKEVSYTDSEGKLHSWIDDEDFGRWNIDTPIDLVKLYAIVEAIEKYEGITTQYHPEGYMTRNPGITEAIKAKGYDAILQSEYGDELVVFSSTQIKSATGNDGTFDGNDASILSGIETLTVDGVQRPRHNSKGQVIHPTDEGIRNFWRWFGDSKVVDEQGRPLVVYHATQADFDTFSKEKHGTAIDQGTLGVGFYFTSDLENVNNYARNMNTNTGKTGNESIMPVYVKIKNPYTVGTAFEVSGKDRRESEKYTERLKQKKFDGIIAELYSFNDDRLTWVVAFEPTQIKSATGNDGTFDGNDGSILSGIEYDVRKNPIYKLAERVKEILKERDVDVSFSVSQTDYGTSAYFTVYDNNSRLILKVRISDHSVTNYNRIFDEVHEDANSDPYRIADHIEKVKHPERFDQVQTGVVYYRKQVIDQREGRYWMEQVWPVGPVVDGKAWIRIRREAITEKELAELNPETNRIIEKEFQFISKKKNKIYKATIEYLIDVIEKPVYKMVRKQHGGGLNGIEKQPWEMTRNEIIESEIEKNKIFGDSYPKWITNNTQIEIADKRTGIIYSHFTLAKANPERIEKYGKRAHYNIVKIALSEGRPVPAEVLADYPDLIQAQNPAPAPFIMRPAYKNQHELNNAIEAFVKENTGKLISDADKAFIRQYTGSGGLAAKGAEGKGLLYEFYTPDWLCDLMYELAYAHGYDNGRILEPSCATGELIRPAKDKANVTGFEINPVSAEIARMLYPQATVYTGYFETAFLERPRYSKALRYPNHTWLPKFSLVIGNPPYGVYKNMYSAHFDKKLFRQIEIFFIVKGLELLQKGGLLVYLQSSNFLRNGDKYNNAKEHISLLADMVDAYRLPKVFKYSDVPTDIMILRKKI